MIFTETTLTGAFIIDLEPREDDRGASSLGPSASTSSPSTGSSRSSPRRNLAFNATKGTLRGMHFQFPPQAETKLVRGTRGAILDIIVDLRPESPTYLQHVGGRAQRRQPPRALRARALRPRLPGARGRRPRRATRSASSTRPGREGGLRYDDPRLGLEWPLPVSEISEKDAAWKLARRGRGRAEGADECLSERDGRTGGRHDHRRHRAARPARREGRPIRVGMVGAGFMGQGLTNQIVNSVPGHAHGGDLQPQARARRRRLPLLRDRRRRRSPTPRRRSTTRCAPGAAVVADDPMLLCRSDADRRDRRRDRVGRVRRPRDPRGVHARQARRADERRGRRDDRADPPGLRRARTASSSRPATATSPACR